MMKLAVLQRLLRAGERHPQRGEIVKTDLWQIARTTEDEYLEYDPEVFLGRLVDALEIRLMEQNKEVRSFRGKLKRIDEIYTPDEVLTAFKRAWNDVTRAIKAETIKVI